MQRNQIIERIIAEAAVAVIRLDDPGKMVPVARALLRGGVSSLEVTMTIPGALSLIEILTRAFGDDALVGVGSVLDSETAKKAIDAGAQYLVSPVFLPEMIDIAHRHGIPAMPGCFTPTEIYHAFEAGADIIKVFPANITGMAFFKAVKAPMPQLRLMPTGGVNLTNAGDWLNAGACAVGLGSALLDKQAIANGDYQKLTENAKLLKQSIDDSRKVWDE